MAAPEIHTIDCDYVRPRFAAAFLRVAGGEAAFVETNTSHAVPKLLAELTARGLSPEAVRFVIVTHVHLDHAGGAGALMRACPNATLLAHPRAARHLVDPSKLVASATKVYGVERFRALYGEVEAVPKSRVRAIDDGATVELGGDTLRFVYVRGHASHHFAVHDPAASAVFTGDAFGLVYPDLQGRGLFAFPSTSPTDFDAAEARASIDRIVAIGAERAYLTHFGAVTAIDAAAAQLRAWLDLSEAAQVEAAASNATAEDVERAVEAKLWQSFEAKLAPNAEEREIVRLDVELNAQGIAWAARRPR